MNNSCILRLLLRVSVLIYGVEIDTGAHQEILQFNLKLYLWKHELLISSLPVLYNNLKPFELVLFFFFYSINELQWHYKKVVTYYDANEIVSQSLQTKQISVCVTDSECH